MCKSGTWYESYCIEYRIQQETAAFYLSTCLRFRIVLLIIFKSQLDTTTMDSILMSLVFGLFEDRWIDCPL